MTYTDENRGTFQNNARAKQLIRFDGMTFENISPTDIDAFIEYHDKAYVLFECKSGDADMSRGQRLALERMTDDLQRAGKETVLLICEHNVPCCDDVFLKQTAVRRYYRKKRYHETKGKLTAREFADKFLKYVEVNDEKSNNSFGNSSGLHL